MTKRCLFDPAPAPSTARVAVSFVREERASVCFKSSRYNICATYFTVMAKRGQYYDWNEGSMRLALLALSKKEVELNEASRLYGVPKATLKRRLDDKNLKAKRENQIIGSTEDLTPDIEKKIVEHILELERCLYGITPSGTTTTAVCFASAAGHFIPPLIIFKRKRAKDDETTRWCSTWHNFRIQSRQWLYKQRNILCLDADVLLILDGHTTHTKNLEAINYAQNHNGDALQHFRSQ